MHVIFILVPKSDTKFILLELLINVMYDKEVASLISLI